MSELCVTTFLGVWPLLASPDRTLPAGPDCSLLPAPGGPCAAPALAQAVPSTQNALPLNICPLEAQRKHSLL